MDATDLQDLPLTNDDPNLPHGVDIEEFWRGEGRKPSRVLLRHGDNAMAIAVAKAAAKAAAAAAEASEKAKEAIETGDAELAAEAALECQQAAMASNDFIQKEIQKTQVSRKDFGKSIEWIVLWIIYLFLSYPFILCNTGLETAITQNGS